VEEMQAVSAVLKGKYTMTGEAFDPVEVDMGRSEENNITQSGGTEWSKRDKSTYDPTDDIEALYYPSSAEKIGQFSLPAVRMPYRA
ncbi:major capsid protein, partial [Escherichia coli]|nr:major capsid protein [Escherichia coli]